ncbi:MAG: hypothetical protein KF699_03950 [Phycisphaeraceae bacterium]|nr:hypothetical protein [Phycisphaeraceae bacterium]
MTLEIGLDFFRRLWSVQTLVERLGGVLIALFATVLVASIALNYSTCDLAWRLFVGPVAGIGAFVAWFVGRDVYLRAGGGRRIGVCLRGDAVSPAVWRATTREVARIQSHSSFQRTRARLRLIPEVMADDSAVRDATAARYGFTAILVLEVSKRLDQPDKTRFDIKLSSSSRKSLSEEFVAATQLHMTRLVQSQGAPGTVEDLLRYRAQAVAEVLLMSLGIEDISRGNLTSAFAFLDALERRVSNRFSQDEHPRKAIRWLAQQALILPSAYPNACPPGPVLLEVAIQACQTAIDRFGDQFPDVFAAQARNFFFAGKLSEAIECTDRCLAGTLVPRTRAHAVLNAAVLNLFLANWDLSAKHFEELLSADLWGHFAFAGLRDFADCSREMGYDSAILLQALYRHCLVGEDVANYDKLARVWLNEDRSRNRLRRIFETTASRFRSQLAQANKDNHKAKKSGQAQRTAFKRRKKPR